MVARHFQTHVFIKRIIITKTIHRDRVVNHQIDRGKRIHFVGIAAEAFHRFTHGGQVYNRRYAGKVLHQHARRAIGYLTVSVGLFKPSSKRLNIVSGNGIAVLPAEQVFQKNFE